MANTSFRCRCCGLSYYSAGDVRRHLRKKHPEWVAQFEATYGALDTVDCATYCLQQADLLQEGQVRERRPRSFDAHVWAE